MLLQYCVNKFLHRFDAGANMLMTEEARNAVLPAGGFAAFLTRHSYLLSRARLALLERPAVAGGFPWDAHVAVATAWQDAPWKMFEEHLAGPCTPGCAPSGAGWRW